MDSNPMIRLYVHDSQMREMADTIANTYNTSITARSHIDSQVICTGEEAGEFLGAYRRFTGRARRSGTRKEMLDELADVIISACHVGWLLGVSDFQALIDHKMNKVLTRGWSEDNSHCSVELYEARSNVVWSCTLAPNHALDHEYRNAQGILLRSWL